MRHPFELGGGYWATNIIMNQLFCFVSVFLYERFVVDNSSIVEGVRNNSTSIDNAIVFCNSTNSTYTANIGCVQNATKLPLWSLVMGLFVLSMLSFFIFSRLINKEYLWTFYDFRIGKDFVVDNFLKSESDYVKFRVFTHHRSYYLRIYKELKVWLDENWEKWEEDKPDWFDAYMIGLVPSELLPAKTLQKFGGERGRKKSIAMMAKAEEKEMEGKLKVKRFTAARVVPLV